MGGLPACRLYLAVRTRMGLAHHRHQYLIGQRLNHHHYFRIIHPLIFRQCRQVLSLTERLQTAWKRQHLQALLSHKTFGRSEGKVHHHLPAKTFNSPIQHFDFLRQVLQHPTNNHNHLWTLQKMFTTRLSMHHNLLMAFFPHGPKMISLPYVTRQPSRLEYFLP